MKSFLRQNWTYTSIAILLVAASWIGITAAFFPNSTNGFTPAPQEGFLAPDFALETLAGETITLSELRGKAVLINFWTSWCPPCRAEMPAMEQVFRDYQDNDFVILAVNVTSQDSIVNATSFVDENQLTFPILLDTEGTTSRQYRVSSFPSSFFVAPDGVIREIVIGGPMAEALIRTRAENLMEGEP